MQEAPIPGGLPGRFELVCALQRKAGPRCSLDAPDYNPMGTRLRTGYSSLNSV